MPSRSNNHVAQQLGCTMHLAYRGPKNTKNYHFSCRLPNSFAPKTILRCPGNSGGDYRSQVISKHADRQTDRQTNVQNYRRTVIKKLEQEIGLLRFRICHQICDLKYGSAILGVSGLALRPFREKWAGLSGECSKWISGNSHQSAPHWAPAIVTSHDGRYLVISEVLPMHTRDCWVSISDGLVNYLRTSARDARNPNGFHKTIWVCISACQLLCIVLSATRWKLTGHWTMSFKCNSIYSILICNPHYENNVECSGCIIEEFRHYCFNSLKQNFTHTLACHNYSYVKFTIIATHLQ